MRKNSTYPLIRLACRSLAATALGSGLLLAQAPAGAAGDSSLFTPITMAPAPSATRLASGAPGPKYWQNRADYDLKGTLDTATGMIRGSLTLRYTNNSPDVLKSLWFQIEQQQDSLEHFTQTVGGKPVALTTHAGADAFELEATLAEPLQPGKTATIEVTWHFPCPPTGYRMGHDGPLYEIAQWYPRVNVYDDVKGWNLDSYATDAEFYLDYGDYTLEVTVPASYIVAASGTLDNPQAVLTSTEISRLAQAAKSDSVVHVITAAELTSGAARPTKTGTLTWKFHATNVRDAVWVAAPDYQWDATNWHGILAQSYYRPSAAQTWSDAADQARMSVQEYTERWFPYTWPQISVVEGGVGGMEYPMLAMESGNQGAPALYSVLTHEVGHQWFPMIVGSNERVHAWMDEGFNTFINTFSEARRYPQNGAQEARFSPWVASGNESILESGNPTPNTDGAQYNKTAQVLQVLRQAVLGPAVFDSAFRTYIRRWAYKHPTPMDFFRTMNDVSGQDLTWFWRECFLEGPAFDQAIDSVAQTTQGSKTSVTVTYGNKARMVFPLLVHFTFSDNSTQDVTYPADVWKANPTKYTVSYTFQNKTVRNIVLDTAQYLPDSDRSNNSWTAK